MKCSDCGRNYEYKRSKGHTKARCNSCVIGGRRYAIKRRAVKLLGGKCKVCGYSRCFRAMVFHHPTARKDFIISGAHARAWATIEREVRKCELLCANCHAEWHCTGKYGCEHH